MTDDARFFLAIGLVVGSHYWPYPMSGIRLGGIRTVTPLYAFPFNNLAPPNAPNPRLTPIFTPLLPSAWTNLYASITSH